MANKDIYRISDTLANVWANLENGKTAVLSDSDNEHVWMYGDKLYFPAVSKEYNGSAYTYHDGFFDDLTVYGNSLSVTQDILHVGDTDTKISFADDSIVFSAGNATMLSLVEDTADYAQFGCLVGMGMTPATAPLDIKANASNYNLCLVETGAGAEAWQIGVDADGDLCFYNDGVLVHKMWDADAEFTTQGLAKKVYTDINCYSATVTDYPALVFLKSHQDTLGATTTIDGDVLARTSIFGVDSGNNYDLGATIITTQVGAAGTKVPCKMEFSTSTNAATNVALTIDEAQNIGIGVAPECRGHFYVNDNALDGYTANGVIANFQNAGTGDAGIGFETSDQIWSMFIDNSVATNDLRINDVTANKIMVSFNTSINFAPVSDIDITFGCTGPATLCRMDWGLGFQHFPDTRGVSFGTDPGTSPDGKIYSDGTNLKVVGQLPGTAVTQYHWLVSSAADTSDGYFVKVRQSA